MAEVNTLDHLLEIEAQAAALVNDAQEEADRRLRENEDRNRALYNERIKSEINIRQTQLNDEIEKIKNKYNKALDDYRAEINNVKADVQAFSGLLNKYLSDE